MGAFCRPNATGPEWIAGLDRYLTLSAASAYATVDPARVRCRDVVGAPQAKHGDGFSRLVTVMTDAGPYRVTVTRASLSDRWLVFHIAPASAR